MRSVERAGEVDETLVIRVNAVHGSASVVNAGSQAVAVVAAAVAVVRLAATFHGGRFH